MRTKADLDVEKLLRQAMRERGEPFKQVLNDAVRGGLHVISERKTVEKPVRAQGVYVETFSPGGTPT